MRRISGVKRSGEVNVSVIGGSEVRTSMTCEVGIGNEESRLLPLER